MQITIGEWVRNRLRHSCKSTVRELMAEADEQGEFVYEELDRVLDQHEFMLEDAKLWD